MGLSLGLDGLATEQDKERKQILEDFGATMAERPIDMENVSKLRKEVYAKGEDGLVLEAASIIGAFALMTSVVDATGRKEVQGMVEMTVKKFSGYKE